MVYFIHNFESQIYTPKKSSQSESKGIIISLGGRRRLQLPIIKLLDRFCFVKVWPPYIDPFDCIQDALKLYERMDEDLISISEKIKDKMVKTSRDQLVSELAVHNSDLWKVKLVLESKLEVLRQLYAVEDKMSLSNTAFQKKAMKSISPEDDLDIQELKFRLRHGAKSLVKEKQLLSAANLDLQRKPKSVSHWAQLISMLEWYGSKKFQRLVKDIKQIQLASESGHGNVPVKGKACSSSSLRESLTEQVKVACNDLMDISKKKMSCESKIKQVEKKLEAINKEIWSLQKHIHKYYMRDDAYLCTLDQRQVGEECVWVLRRCKLEHQSCSCIRTQRCCSNMWNWRAHWGKEPKKYGLSYFYE